MATHGRIHVTGGLYYITHYRPPDRSAVISAGDLPLVRLSLGAALSHFGLHAYAFFICSGRRDYLHYLVRIANEPASHLVTSVERRRANALGVSRRMGRRVFVRHSIRLLEPRYLPRVARYLHLLPVHLQLAQSEHDWLSSDAAYRGLERYAWLHVHTAWHSWPVDASMARQVYRLQGSTPLDPADVRLIEHGSELNPHVIGSPDFVRSLLASHLLAKRMTLPELCEAIVAGFGITPEDLHSRSHRHVFVVARAFLTDYAIRRDKYKRTEVAEYLSHSGVDLWATVKRHRAKYPKLFKVERIPRDGSLRELMK